jgi:cytosine/adenosine deaminase-related metal-dependent hydrolase
MKSFTIKNAVIFTVNSQDEVITDGTVSVHNGKITYVGPSRNFNMWIERDLAKRLRKNRGV